MPSINPRHPLIGRRRGPTLRSAAWLVIAAGALYYGLTGHTGVLTRPEKAPLEAVLSLRALTAPNFEPPLGPSRLGLAPGAVFPRNDRFDALLSLSPELEALMRSEAEGDLSSPQEAASAGPEPEETPPPGPPAAAIEEATPSPAPVQAIVPAVPHPVAAAPPSAPPAPVPPTPIPVPAQPVALSAAEQQLLNLHNAERARAGLAPLAVDPRLQSVARQRATDMATRGYFSHYSPSGQTAFTLMFAAGLNPKAAGENIAYNSFDTATTVITAMNGFLSSPAHRANIVSREYNSIGLAMAVSPSGMKYYSVVFALL